MGAAFQRHNVLAKIRVPQVRRALAVGVLMCIAGCSDSNYRLSREEALQRSRKGLELITVFDFAGAERSLSDVPDALEPGSMEWAHAAFGLASSLRYKMPATTGSISESNAMFELVAAESPDEDLRALALLELARGLELQNYPEDTKNLPAARKLYRQVVVEYDGQTFAEEAMVRLANTYFTDVDRPEGFQQGFKLIENYLHRHPDAAMAVVMWEQLGLASRRLMHDPARALAYYEKARQLGFSVPSMKANRLWVMSQLAEEAGDLHTAAAMYSRIISETPRSPQGTISRRRLIEISDEHPKWELMIPERDLEVFRN